jgi:transcriptional regulator
MYIPDQFRVDQLDVLRQFVVAHPLGALIATTPDEGLVANYIPMMWESRGDTSRGALTGHVAKANPIWRVAPSNTPVLVLFSGANHYITPSWYPGKAEHGKVVPTWNYAVVQARGRIRFDQSDERSLEHVSAMTDRQESSQAVPWKVSDAPSDYIATLLRGVVRFEIEIDDVVGKFKSSQHRPNAERAAVIERLESIEIPADARAELIREPERGSGS